MLRVVVWIVLFALAPGIASALPPLDFDPVVRTRTQLGPGTLEVSAPARLLNSRIYLAQRALIDAPIQYESRGRSDLDIFYSGHRVAREIALFVLEQHGSEQVAACSVTNTYIAANIFTSDGRIDGRTCLVDHDGDGRFDELSWSPSQTAHHSVHSFRIVSADPSVSIDVPYRIAPEPYESISEPAYVDVSIFYDPADGFISATLRGSDGYIVERERIRLPRPGSRDRVLDFFGVSIEVRRVDPAHFSWRAIRLLPSDAEFTLSYDYRH